MRGGGFRESSKGSGVPSVGIDGRRAWDRAEGRVEWHVEERGERLVLPAESLPAVPGAAGT